MLVEIGASPVVREMGADNARWSDRSGQLLAVLLHAEETEGRIAAVELAETAAAPPPRHVHHGHDELIYVLEGEFAFEVDGRRSFAPAGTLLFVPRGVEHGWVVEREPARLLVVCTPGGLEEGFLATSQPAWSLDPATRPGPASAGAGPIHDAERFDSEVTGPPVEPGR